MSRDWFVSSGSQTGIPVSKLGECITYLKNFLGSDWVSEEIHSYRTWRKNNSVPILWNHRPPSTIPLIPMFVVFEDWHAGTTKSNPPTPVIDLANIAGAISYFEPYWNCLKADAGKTHMQFYLKNSPVTCRGMAYELTTALHYAWSGAMVMPLFMNPNQPDKADIIVTWNGVDIELHCKSKIPGAGQKIHADLFDYVAGCTLAYFTQLTSRSLWVKLICSDDLKTGDIEEVLKEIRGLIQTSLVGDFPLCGNRYVLRIKEIAIPVGGITSAEIMKLHKSMYRAILADNAPTLLAGRGYHRVSVFDATSRKKPVVASSLKKSIKQALKQVTGKRPSVVTVHFHDPMDWGMVNRLPLFKAFLEQQLETRQGKNVGALVLTGEPLSSDRWTGRVFQRNLPVLWFRNPHANPQISLPPDFAV